MTIFFFFFFFFNLPFFSSSFSLIFPSTLQVTRRSAHVSGFTFGLTEFATFAIWSLSFWYGSVVVDKGQCSFGDMFKAMMGIFLGMMMLGQVGSLAPDFTKAHAAARWLYTIISSGEAKKVAGRNLKPAMTGDIVLEDIDFTYPARPDAQVRGREESRVKGGQISEGGDDFLRGSRLCGFVSCIDKL